jgi:hypothetical protein
MRRLNEEREQNEKRKALREIPYAVERICGIGYFDKVWPSIWIPFDNDNGGIDIQIPEMIAVFTLTMCRIIFFIEIKLAGLKKKLFRKGKK